MKKIKSSIALCLVLLTLTGCKDDKKAQPENGKSDEPAVQVVVDMTVNKDDVFQLFYTDGGTDFGPNHVYVNVTGKPESQEIVFDMPENATIGNLRLDVGQNEAQGEMKISKLIIKTGDKEMVISAADFFKYFTPAGYVKADPAKSSFIGIKVDGIYDPFFTGNDGLVQELRKLYQ